MASDEDKVGDTNHNQSKQVENTEKGARKKSKKERQKLKKMEEKKRKGSETTKSDDEENKKKNPRIEEEKNPGRMNLSDNERRRLSLSGGLVEKKGEDFKVTATPLVPSTPVLYHKDHNVEKPTILSLDGGHKDNSKKVTKENRTGI